MGLIQEIVSRLLPPKALWQKGSAMGVSEPHYGFTHPTEQGFGVGLAEALSDNPIPELRGGTPPQYVPPSQARTMNFTVTQSPIQLSSFRSMTEIQLQVISGSIRIGTGFYDLQDPNRGIKYDPTSSATTMKWNGELWAVSDADSSLLSLVALP
jgi:hypothetical protein